MQTVCQRYWADVEGDASERNCSSSLSLIAVEVGKAVVSRIDDCSAAVEPADRTAVGSRRLALLRDVWLSGLIEGP